MSFFARLLGRQGENGCGVKAALPGSSTNKRAQPCSPPSGSFASDFASGRPLAAPCPVMLQNGSSMPPQQQQQHSTGQQQRASVDSDEDDCTIRVPGSLSCSGDRNRSNSLARRRAAIDISPRAVQQLSDKVAALDAGHLDVGSGGVTRCEVEALYSDMQLIHRGRSSMVYRAKEVRSGRRVILKSYDSRTLSSSSRRQALERQVLTLRAAQAAAGAGSSGLVALERVVENADGTYLVVQACNGGTLIEAIANAGGKLPERQVAMKVALPLLNALRQLHTTGIVHRDIKPEHLMIHNGTLKVGDFGSAGCASFAAAALASNLQKQALQAMHKQQQQQQQATAAATDGGAAAAAADQVGQQAVQLQLELEQLQHQQLHLQADCTAEASVAACADGCAAQQQQHQQQLLAQPQGHQVVPPRFGVAADALAGTPSPGVSGRLSVQAAKDAMNFRIGSIEYMAPEMLNKPTAAEVFHLVIAQGIDEDDLPTYDDKVDVWSAGVVLYEALSGLQPFLADSAEDMLTVIGKKMAARLDPAEAQQQAAQQQHYHRHHHQQHRRPSSAGGGGGAAAAAAWVPKQAQDLPAFIARLQVSPDAKDFLASCLTWQPSRRPSTAQLLAHPWLQRMQDEAAAVAASRANSRRLSMQISMQRARLSNDGVATAAGGAAEQQVSLVDPVMAGMLEDSAGGDMHAQHTHEVGYERHNSLDLMAPNLERSQTSEQLEVGARNVLRSRTQRLETRPMHARVHAA